MTIWSLESSSSINKENHDKKQVDKFSMRFYQKVIHCTGRSLVERTNSEAPRKLPLLTLTIYLGVKVKMMAGVVPTQKLFFEFIILTV